MRYREVFISVIDWKVLVSRDKFAPTFGVAMREACGEGKKAFRHNYCQFNQDETRKAGHGTTNASPVPNDFCQVAFFVFISEAAAEGILG